MTRLIIQYIIIWPSWQKMNPIYAPLVLTYNNFVVLIIMSWLVSTVCGSIRLRPGPSRCVRYYWASARCWSASSLAPCSWSPGSGSGSRVSLKFNVLISVNCFLPCLMNASYRSLLSTFWSRSSAPRPCSGASPWILPPVCCTRPAPLTVNKQLLKIKIVLYDCLLFLILFWLF